MPSWVERTECFTVWGNQGTFSKSNELGNSDESLDREVSEKYTFSISIFDLFVSNTLCR